VAATLLLLACFGFAATLQFGEGEQAPAVQIGVVDTRACSLSSRSVCARTAVELGTSGAQGQAFVAGARWLIAP